MANSGIMANNYNPVYSFALFAPAVSAVFMTIIPDWSLRIALIVFGVVLLNMLLVLVLKLTKAVERSPRRRVSYFISQMNLFVVFLLGVVWRVWDGGLLLALGLIVLNAAVAYIGYRYRRIIFQEVLHPKTRTGKIIYAAGLIGGGAAGLIGYGLSRFFSEHFPNMIPFYVTLIFIPVSIYILLVIYAGWIKAEHPDWEPDRKPARRRSGIPIK